MPRAPSRARVAKIYTLSQIAQALERVAEIGVRPAATELGIPRNALRDWERKAAKAATGEGPAPTSCNRARRSGSQHARFSRFEDTVDCEEDHGQLGGERGLHESPVPSPPIPDGGTGVKAAAVAKPPAPAAGRFRRPIGLLGGRSSRYHRRYR